MDERRITFEKKPIPLPAEYRPMYQIALLVLVLKLCCRANASSLEKLHLFSWCLRSSSNMTELERYLKDGVNSPMLHWTIDPALNRAINYAVADGICEFTPNKKYKLTSKGCSFFSKIENDKELFNDEKDFLLRLGKKLSDEKIDVLTTKR